MTDAPFRIWITSTPPPPPRSPPLKPSTSLRRNLSGSSSWYSKSPWMLLLPSARADLPFASRRCTALNLSSPPSALRASASMAAPFAVSCAGVPLIAPITPAVGGATGWAPCAGAAVVCAGWPCAGAAGVCAGGVCAGSSTVETVRRATTESPPTTRIPTLSVEDMEGIIRIAERDVVKESQRVCSDCKRRLFSVLREFCRATLRLVKMKRPPGLTLLAGALLVLMPALAVLQFRWVGQVSDAEQDRMRRNVEVAAQQFRESFSQEVGRALEDTRVRAAAVRDGNWDGFADRYDQWLKEATHPGLIRNIYLVVAEGGQPVARRWDVEARTFTQIPWPSALEPWKADFVAELEDFNAAQAFPQPQDQRPPRFQGQDTLIVGPLRGQVSSNLRSAIDPDTGSRRLTTEFAFGFPVMELNPSYIRDTFLPDLVQRHFTHGDSYRVSVIDSDNPKDVIYRSDANAATSAGQADACQGVFPGFGRRPGTSPPVAGDGPGRAGASGRDQRPSVLEPCGGANNPSVGRAAVVEPGQGDGRGRDEQPGRWRLLVQHPSGSLEAAVAGARRRNVALSFGVLLLLTLSIGLLAIASRKAQRLAEQQIEFVAGISHELRTPVAVIRSAAENLSQGVVGNTERVKRYGQMIEGEARRLGEMVERVLQYAGIESGLGFGARTSLAPAEIIQSAVDSAIPLLGPESVDIHRDIPESLPPVMGDAAALRSAVQNLVANAVKYGGRDRWVGIRAEHVQEHRRSEVRITVSDHGAGIPAGELPHIFEPFYRGGDALARQIHGNGLGLSLVKRIVGAHGGRVTVETRAGVGSSFTITLPAAEPDVASTSVASEVRAAAHP